MKPLISLEPEKIGISVKALLQASHEEICIGGHHPDTHGCALNLQLMMEVEEIVVGKGQVKRCGRTGSGRRFKLHVTGPE